MVMTAVNNDKITLKVVGLGHNFTFETTREDTVADVKAAVEHYTSLPSVYQKILARGKKLNDDNASLSSMGIQNRTRMMLLPSDVYNEDRAGFETIKRLSDEIDKMISSGNATENSPTSFAIHEQITQICCKLDGIDTHGSETLRNLRKKAILKAEAFDQSSSSSSY